MAEFGMGVVTVDALELDRNTVDPELLIAQLDAAETDRLALHCGYRSGGVQDNNGSGNNDKNKPGDTPDGQGADKLMTSSFNDAF